MIRVMLDTDDSAQLTATPIRAAILATYADQVDAGVLADLKRSWPQVVLIDRGMGDPLGRASVIDVEKGARLPGDVPAWISHQRARGIKYLTVYANRSTMPSVDSVMAGHGAGFYRWYATDDGTAHIAGYRPGLTPAAVQIAGADSLGFHADLSLAFEDQWHPAPAAAPPPAAAWVAQAVALAASVQADSHTLAGLLEAHQ